MRVNRLTARKVETLTDAGMHADGAGLYLRVDQAGARRWVFIFQWLGRRREMGLGSAMVVTLAKAREAAAAARTLVAAGQDPIAERARAAAPPQTFGDALEAAIIARRDGWGGVVEGRSEAQWRSSFRMHAARLMALPVAEVTTAHVVQVLRPVWRNRPETARRLRSRIEHVLDRAAVEGQRSGENPARWKGHLEFMLAEQAVRAGHHAAMPYEDVPAFLTQLRGRPATAARALEFCILTATRTAEALGARWGEIAGDVWTIPPERMKAGLEHEVPLSAAALNVLEEMRRLPSPASLVFPGQQLIEPLSQMSMLMLLRRMGVADATVHGFRSSFRDWAGDMTDHDEAVAEAALAHAAGGKVQKAYRRRRALEKRRRLMEDWAAYCTSGATNVVSLRA